MPVNWLLNNKVTKHYYRYYIRMSPVLFYRKQYELVSFGFFSVPTFSHKIYHKAIEFHKVKIA